GNIGVSLLTGSYGIFDARPGSSQTVRAPSSASATGGVNPRAPGALSENQNGLGPLRDPDLTVPERFKLCGSGQCLAGNSTEGASGLEDDDQANKYQPIPEPVVIGAGAIFPEEVVAEGFGELAFAGKYGVKPYWKLRKLLNRTGLQAHHLIEKRFAKILGERVGRMASVAVTKAEHQAFTKAWRDAIPLGVNGTGRATRAQILRAAKEIYKKYPGILKALGL
ncbi:MAG TPA: hypothetical protein VIM69_00245, partial [Opitutaceae bacterium]